MDKKGQKWNEKFCHFLDFKTIYLHKKTHIYIIQNIYKCKYFVYNLIHKKVVYLLNFTHRFGFIDKT